ncbi:MAG: hypothetical protein IPI78_14985 [Chitinophagaceae bacterium]|nr:hypothetical protein [Chitinophagaceae bacterium]
MWDVINASANYLKLIQMVSMVKMRLHYNVIERFGYVTLVQCVFRNGKNSPDKVHMKYMGHPLFNINDFMVVIRL